MPDIRIERPPQSEQESLLAFLRSANLPTDGVIDHWHTMLVALREGRIVGTVGLEIYEDGALLRSVAVDASLRGHGLGHRLTEAAIRLAEDQGVHCVYLLTTTAEAFFPRFGFVPITRAEVPGSVRQSVEFTSACPSSARVMRKDLRANQYSRKMR